MFTSTNNVARLSRLAGMAAAVASAAPAFGQLIAYDGFPYPAYAPLNAVGSGGTGWAGAWNASGPGIWNIHPVGSTYNAGGFSLVRAGGRIFGNMANSQRTMSVIPPLGNVVPQTIWVSFIAQQTSGSVAGTWLGVKLPCTVGAGINSFLFLGKPYNDASWGTDAGSIASHRLTNVPATSKAFYVARIDLRTNGALDDVRVWINPGLATAPTNASANLTLPNYGNFEGITKVLTEVGGPHIDGNIDEIRIGRDFRSVAPIRDGIFQSGIQHEPLGGAQLTLSADAGRVEVSNLGSTGNDGVRIVPDSHGGSGVAILAPDLPPGASITVRDTNWDGQDMSFSSITRLENGGIQFIGNYQQGMPPSVTSVHVTAYDAAGTLVSDTTTQGSSATVDLPAILMGLPCPGGGDRFWYQTFEAVSHPITPASGRIVWRFGCGEGAINQNSGAHIVVDAAFADDGGGTGHLGGTKDPHKKEVTTSGLNTFAVSNAAIMHSGLQVSGLGDAEVSQICGDADCTADLQQLSVGNIGGTGQDGVRVAMPADVGAIQYSLGTPALSQSVAGEMTHSLSVRTQSGELRQVLAKVKRLENNRVEFTIDPSQLGNASVGVSVSNDGSPVGSAQGGAQGMRIFIDGMEIWSDFMLHCYLRYLDLMQWSLIGPSGSNPLTITIDNSGALATYSGNALSIDIFAGEPMVALDNLAITGKDLGYGIIDITSLVWTGLAASCPADFDSDGTVDFFDYDAFVNAFESGASNADFDQDGTIDFFDYDAFVNAFELGC